MTGLGLVMGGKIYPFQTENPLTILAFFADIGNGLVYVLSRFLPIGLGAPRADDLRIRHGLHRRRRPAELPRRPGRARHRRGEEVMILESHLVSMILYAFFVAVVLALLRRREGRKARIRYGLFLFLIMVGGALVFGWFMYLFI